MLEDFADEDRTVGDDELERMYTPVGLDLGGGSPSQIAHSIVAELLAVDNDRTPQHLSEREGRSIGECRRLPTTDTDCCNYLPGQPRLALRLPRYGLTAVSMRRTRLERSNVVSETAWRTPSLFSFVPGYQGESVLRTPHD
ncbi:hypothetical protein D8S78_23670 [Natrialba swarupiae]|nr:hypothetical protein [Natrialba swarupiae]